MSVRWSRLSLGLLSLVGACGGGQDGADSQPEPSLRLLETPALVGSSVWDVDREASSVRFVGSMNDKPFEGSFSNIALGVALDPQQPQNEGVIEALIDLGSVDAGDSEKNNALPTETWFHIDAHPVATFRADKVIKTGPETYEADGTLTLKGLSKPVVMPFSLAIDDTGRAVADGSVTLDRSDFAVGTGEFANGKWVAFEVEVRLHVEAEPQGQ